MAHRVFVRCGRTLAESLGTILACRVHIGYRSFVRNAGSNAEHGDLHPRISVTGSIPHQLPIAPQCVSIAFVLNETPHP